MVGDGGAVGAGGAGGVGGSDCAPFTGDAEELCNAYCALESCWPPNRGCCDDFILSQGWCGYWSGCGACDQEEESYVECRTEQCLLFCRDALTQWPCLYWADFWQCQVDEGGCECRFLEQECPFDDATGTFASGACEATPPQPGGCDLMCGAFEAQP